MIRLHYFILFIIVLLLFSCHKDKKIAAPSENYQIPCSYFPAHPGTWWMYITNSEEITFEIDSIAHKVGDIYLPYFKNLDCYIKGCEFYHSAYYGLGRSGYQAAPIILESNVNSESQTISTVSFANMFVNEFINGAGSIQHRRVLYGDTSSVTNMSGLVFDNVIVMKEFDINDTTHYYLEYFAHNIGLVKRDSINTIDTSNLIEILTLNQYFIND
jgi:hypothetical protein